MPWRIRFCGKNLYHHIYVWGNDRHPVFKMDGNYRYYLKLLADFSEKFSIDIIAYALMEWHIHLFIFDRLNKISLFMQNLHGEYAKYFNNVTGRVGHVFGERYNNKIIQPNLYGLWLSRYIHRQPVEAGLVLDPKDYPWTSYRQYIGLQKIEFIKPQVILHQFGTNNRQRRKYYKEFVLEDKEDIIDWDKSQVLVVGDMNFVRKIKKTFNIKGKAIINKEELLLTICNDLGVTVDCILNPKDKIEREQRHKAIRMLAKEYNLKICEIANILGITRFAVMKVLR
ncbi:MAG: transposase [candidate division WOR-3 bacterium]